MDKIIEKMIDFLPLWYVISIVLIAIIMKFYYARFKPLEDKTIHADCINKNGKIDRLVTDVDKLKDDVSDIKEDISAIKAVLIQKFPNAAAVFSMKKSPRKLNELGEDKLYDITLGDVSFVLSLPLRDLYLEAHPELLSTETDLQYI